ncbi:MAG: cbb3-type cytochrome c oxidase subunit I [Planctomycetota bacterium]|nr:cbb3-type cytochrome c oxidase subunit I [Planctomycetota bacterium]
MSTATIHPGKVGHEPAPSGDNYLNHGRSFASWALTLDHKRIALLYLVGVMSAYGLGGFFALMLRTELFTAAPTLMSDPARAWDFYNQMFTLHGAVMVFMFIIPAIPAILGNFALPLMLGAKDVAFPRLNLASFYCWVGGGCFFVIVLLKGILNALFPALASFWGAGGLETGWTFYTPYSTTTTNSAVVEATFGAFILGFSSILTGLNFIATLHMLRPKGMTWFRMPLFLWALYATSVIQILATPVLAITLLLLIAERTLKIGIFDSSLGGDPVLYQHFFWFYSHPAVYIMILPAMGVVSELVSTFSRRHIFGYKFIAMSSLAIAFVGFLVWGHHLFVSGQSPLANSIFSFLTFLVAVPSAIKTFNWVSTLYKGDIHLHTPMVYALIMIFLFTIGGLTGLFLGSISLDIHLTDTYFVIAHFHYVMMGSTLFAFLGGLYYWWPKITGKMYNERFGSTAAIIAFLGMNLTFFPQFIMGSQGMPRRYATYPDQFTIYHQLSTVGAYIMGFGMFLVLLNLISSLRNGRPAPKNPWGSNSLEWQAATPPPHDNFPVTPEAGDPYDYSQWDYVSPEVGYVKSDRPPAPYESH